MKRLLIAAVAIGFAGIGVTGTISAAELLQRVQARALADTVKPGQWEFTSQMEMPGMPKLPPGVQLPPNAQMQQSGMKSTYKTCVDSERAVPSDPRGQCRIEHVQRNGATVTWTGTCTTAQGTVRSEGVAHYSGDTMEANLTTQVPGANGQAMNTTQHITGHYLGACAR
ncbi:MAG: DUF3617 family protein [Alphaproteobacteria bacterium]|nr:DUF3617 family protein [Alphaproteobacteria bacterium]MBV9015883.1 DUF3617 family protein [Alphaproteobacteria bacterium]MBV9583663.1 DUF3617 family protein [Alphaproteobacteria bacterium]